MRLRGRRRGDGEVKKGRRMKWRKRPSPAQRACCSPSVAHISRAVTSLIRMLCSCMQAGNRPIARRRLDAHIQPRRRLAERHSGEETGLKGRRSGCRVCPTVFAQHHSHLSRDRLRKARKCPFDVRGQRSDRGSHFPTPSFAAASTPIKAFQLARAEPQD